MLIEQIVGTALLPCVQPVLAGYIYGITGLATSPNFTSEIKSHPFLSSIDLITYGTLYGMGAGFLSKVYFPSKKNDYLICAVLLGVSGYKLYEFIKK
jgi:hypothetical protein